jgi:NADH:ubiquinone oxidoreductase subunit 4 (subunit M)
LHRHQENPLIFRLNLLENISFAWHIDNISLGFAIITMLIWLFFAFYSSNLLKLHREYFSKPWQMFFLLILSIIYPLFLSQNLITILFFYQILLIVNHTIIGRYCLPHKNNSIDYFDLITYVEVFLLLVVGIFVYKLNHNINFNDSPIIAENLGKNHIWLFAMLIFGLFLAILLPSFLLFKKLNLDVFWLFLWLFFGYSLPSLFILSKVSIYIFGSQGLMFLLKNINLNWLILIFSLYFIFLNITLNLTKNLQTWFLLLFWQQLNFILFSILIHNLVNLDYTYLSIASFLLLFLLLFFCINNIRLHNHCHNLQNYDALFYKMPITCSLFIFAVLMAIGITPTISLVDKIFLIKTIIKNQLLTAFLPLIINAVGLAFCLYKFCKIFLQNPVNFSKDQLDFSLIIIPLFVAILAIFSTIFYPFLYSL